MDRYDRFEGFVFLFLLESNRMVFEFVFREFVDILNSDPTEWKFNSIPEIVAWTLVMTPKVVHHPSIHPSRQHNKMLSWIHEKICVLFACVEKTAFNSLTHTDIAWLNIRFFVALPLHSIYICSQVEGIAAFTPLNDLTTTIWMGRHSVLFENSKVERLCCWMYGGRGSCILFITSCAQQIIMLYCG